VFFSKDLFDPRPTLFALQKILCGFPKSCLIGRESWQVRRRIGMIFQKIRQVFPKIILISSES
jgi:hypothetical protein